MITKHVDNYYQQDAVLSNQNGDILKGMLTHYQRVDSVLTIYVRSPMNMTYLRYPGVDLL